MLFLKKYAIHIYFEQKFIYAGLRCFEYEKKTIPSNVAASKIFGVDDVGVFIPKRLAASKRFGVLGEGEAFSPFSIAQHWSECLSLFSPEIRHEK